jgi:hypothetical protein
VLWVDSAGLSTSQRIQSPARGSSGEHEIAQTCASGTLARLHEDELTKAYRFTATASPSLTGRIVVSR